MGRFSRLITTVAMAILYCGIPQAAPMAKYPDRPIHLIVGIAPGGAVDFMARLIAQKLTEKLGQPVLVDNRTGAEGTIAINYVAHAAPDGYTLAFVANADAVAPLQVKVPYDFVRDFAPIINAGYSPDVLVVNPTTLPVSNIAEFVAAAKANPGKLSYGTSGAGGIEAIELLLMVKETGIQMVDIPYRGAAPALTATLGGEVQATMITVSTAIEQIKAGKVRPLMVTGPARVSVLPDVPTVSEIKELPLLAGVSRGGIWHGVSAPAGTPKEIVEQLNSDIAGILKSPDIQKSFAARSTVIVDNSPEDFAKLIASDTSKWAGVLKLLGIEQK